MLPRTLLEFTHGEDSVELAARTLAEVIAQLDSRFRGLGERILDDQGVVRKFVHIFVNEDSVGHLNPEEVSLAQGDSVHILPSIAGG